MFSGEKAKARRHYRAYMSEDLGVGKEQIYGTRDQRILGDEIFAEKVRERGGADMVYTKRLKEYSLKEIVSGIEGMYGIDLKEIRRKGKGRGIMLCRKLFSLVSREYGYKGKEIADYIQKDPAVVTRYLSEREDLKAEVERVIERRKRSNVNSQV